jgi:hypothetical protein
MLRSRHVWLAQKAAESFGLDEEECKSSVRKNLQRINDFLNGEPSCPSHILAYLQPRESAEPVRAPGSPAALPPLPAP